MTNEAIIVCHPGDSFPEVLKTTIEVVNVPGIGYALIKFNDVKVFVLKDTTEESGMAEYLRKLKSLTP